MNVMSWHTFTESGAGSGSWFCGSSPANICLVAADSPICRETWADPDGGHGAMPPKNTQNWSKFDTFSEIISKLSNFY